MKPLFAIVFILISTVFYAPVSYSADEQTLKEVKTYFNHYINHFNRFLENAEDKEALSLSAGDISFPAVWISNRGNKIIAKNNEFVIENSEKFINFLRAQGVAKIEWEAVNIKLLNTNTAIASNIAKLYQEDGKLFKRSAGMYLIHKKNNTWKLFSRIQHDPKHNIQF